MLTLAHVHTVGCCAKIAILASATLGTAAKASQRLSPIWPRQKLAKVARCREKMESWHLSDQTVSSKGQKSCQLTADHQPLKFTLGDGLRTRFGASTFDKVDVPRRNLDFDLEEGETLERLKAIDAWAIEYITANSERLLKKKLSRPEVENGYTMLVRTYGSCSSCKTKINIRGSRACTYWDDKG